MGAVATLNDQRILSSGRLILPSGLEDNLEFFHIMTNGLAASLNNWANTGEAIKVGSPVANDGYMSFRSGADYFTSVLTEPHEGTYLAVCRQTSSDTGSNTSRAYWIGTHNGSGANIGAGLFSTSATQVASNALMINSALTTAAITAIITDTPTTWGIRLQTFSDTVDKTYNATLNISNQVTPGAGYIRSPSLRKVNIGSSSGNTFGGTNDILLAVAWSRVLTDAERTVAVNLARNFAAAKGIAV